MSQEELKKFYNYKNWREIQRNQLTISSNIFFTFSVTITGFVINFLLNNKNELSYCIKEKFALSIIFSVLAIMLYSVMNIIKLVDYRLTAKLIRKNKIEEIRLKTKIYGNSVWFLYYTQILFAFFGFIFCLIAFRNIIL